MIDDGAKACLKELNVLYVEDNAETQDEIAFFLNKRVKKLFIAANGLDGLQYVDANDIDIIVSDIQMPYLNGIEMAEKVKQSAPEIPIIFITAFNDSYYLKKAKEIGVLNYIQKPTDLMELFMALSSIATKIQKKKSQNA
jgi:YesN/AraC family two-component response regulator